MLCPFSYSLVMVDDYAHDSVSGLRLNDDTDLNRFTSRLPDDIPFVAPFVVEIVVLFNS